VERKRKATTKDYGKDKENDNGKDYGCYRREHREHGELQRIKTIRKSQPGQAGIWNEECGIRNPGFHCFSCLTVMSRPYRARCCVCLVSQGFTLG